MITVQHVLFLSPGESEAAIYQAVCDDADTSAAPEPTFWLRRKEPKMSIHYISGRDALRGDSMADGSVVYRDPIFGRAYVARAADVALLGDPTRDQHRGSPHGDLIRYCEWVAGLDQRELVGLRVEESGRHAVVVTGWHDDEWGIPNVRVRTPDSEVEFIPVARLYVSDWGTARPALAESGTTPATE